MSGECGYENPRPSRRPARTSLSTFSEALFGFGSELKAPSDFATSSDYRMRGRAKADRTNERVSEAVRCSRRMSDMACTVGEGQRYPHSAMQSPSLPCCARSGTGTSSEQASKDAAHISALSIDGVTMRWIAQRRQRDESTHLSSVRIAVALSARRPVVPDGR